MMDSAQNDVNEPKVPVMVTSEELGDGVMGVVCSTPKDLHNAVDGWWDHIMALGNTSEGEGFSVEVKLMGPVDLANLPEL